MRALISRLGAALVLLLAGCQTPLVFPAPDARWETRVGQLQYVTPTRSIIGDCVVSRRGADFQLDFRTGPGFPLLRLWRSGEKARAEGVIARGSWQGDPAHPPANLVGFMKLPAAFSAQKHTPRVIVNSAETGERFVFVFAK